MTVNNLINNSYNQMNNEIIVYRNIGEIVISSFPIIDSSLHLADGSVIKYGLYSSFIDYMSLHINTNPEYFCTLQEYEQSVADYGVCGKYVYDSDNNTIKLPTLCGFLEGTNNNKEAGSIVQAGLPNIIGALHLGDGAFFNLCSGAFSHLSGLCYEDPNTALSGSGVAHFDASNYNAIYGNSNTVQPQSVKVLYYIVLATTGKKEKM